MKIAKRFARFPWLYYIVVAGLNVGAILMTLQLPRLFVDWVVGPLFGYVAGIFVTFGLLGLALADVKGRQRSGWIAIPVVCGFVAAGTLFLVFLLITYALGVSRDVSLLLAEVLIFLQLGVLDALILSYSVEGFGFGKRIRSGLVAAVVALMIFATAIPFSGDYARQYLRVYSFLTEPGVYVNGADGYSVLFATTAPGTGSVIVKKDGVVTTYREEKNAVLLYDRQIHRVDIPKAALEGATYYVESTQCKDGTNVDWVMGRTIQGKSYVFKTPPASGDVSFLCVSDNQGTAMPTQQAVAKACETYDYDFVMMLGDHAESYNDLEDDIINSLLKVSAIASGSVLPVYYTLGNHEYRGMLAPYLWELIPTGSESGEAYYTFTMGDAFFTVLNYANDHADDMPRYAGLGDFNGYKDKEYEWYQQAMAGKPYEAYTYNVVISHIPMVYNDHQTAFDHECEECKAIHGYKYFEFAELYKECGVEYVVSGHTHVKPAEYKSEKYDFVNLHAGSHYNNKTGFRNSIVTLSGGKATYVTYGE